jgi:hypothetical protein
MPAGIAADRAASAFACEGGRAFIGIAPVQTENNWTIRLLTWLSYNTGFEHQVRHELLQLSHSKNQCKNDNLQEDPHNERHARQI